MKKAAVRETQTTTVAQDDIERSLLVFTARRQFVSSTVNMAWQLALTILIPVFIGVKLDDHFHSQPSYTLTALVLATIGAVLVVRRNIQIATDEVNKVEKQSK